MAIYWNTQTLVMNIKKHMIRKVNSSQMQGDKSEWRDNRREFLELPEAFLSIIGIHL